MFPIVFLLVVLFILISGIRVAREYERAVVFRLGRYTGLRGPGLFWLIPLGVENETRICAEQTRRIDAKRQIFRDAAPAVVGDHCGGGLLVP